MANPLIPKKNNSPVKMVDLPHSAGILDDFAVRKNVATKEGTIEQVPTENNHIVNKSYADSLVSNSANWDTAYTHSQDNTQAHSDYMLNTGDTATGNYNFDSGTLFIDSINNRVGVGTATPDRQFEIKGSDSYMKFTKTGIFAGYSEIYNDGNMHMTAENTGQGSKLFVFSGNQVAFRITKDSSVGATKFDMVNARLGVNIGTGNPAYTLDVVGDANVSGIYRVDGTQVVTNQQAHIEDLNAAYAEADLDTAAEVKDAINATNAKINAILAMLEAHGLVASS